MKMAVMMNFFLEFVAFESGLTGHPECSSVFFRYMGHKGPISYCPDRSFSSCLVFCWFWLLWFFPYFSNCRFFFRCHNCPIFVCMIMEIQCCTYPNTLHKFQHMNYSKWEPHLNNVSKIFGKFWPDFWPFLTTFDLIWPHLTSFDPVGHFGPVR